MHAEDASSAWSLYASLYVPICPYIHTPMAAGHGRQALMHAEDAALYIH